MVRGCTIKELPAGLVPQAARVAVAVNPTNDPLTQHPELTAVLKPQHIALLTSKYWGAKGVKLSVSFMDGPDTATRRLIVQHMNAWNRYANVAFAETAGVGQVRIARAADGYWSYLGTDILSIPANQPTMNLQGFTSNTPDSEYRRVVRHETGHTLGFPHEQQRPEVVALLDPAKTYAYFAATQGWDRATVDAQILTPLNPTAIRATAPDVRSIMEYEFPASITRNGVEIPGGLDIDPTDGSFAASIYPPTVPVSPPPPPTPPPSPPPVGPTDPPWVALARVVAGLRKAGWGWTSIAGVSLLVELWLAQGLSVDDVLARLLKR